jgi:hypothetical protein
MYPHPYQSLVAYGAVHCSPDLDQHLLAFPLEKID